MHRIPPDFAKLRKAIEKEVRSCLEQGAGSWNVELGDDEFEFEWDEKGRASIACGLCELLPDDPDEKPATDQVVREVRAVYRIRVELESIDFC